MEISKSERGFKHSDELVCSYGEEITFSESSIAFDPHIWMRAAVPVNPNESWGPKPYPSGVTEVSIHLSAHQAWELRERIDKMLENHYYGDVRPGSEYWQDKTVDEHGRQED